MEELNGNMVFWNQFSKVPPWALRVIKFGSLKGKSDINPAWRLQAMTEVFGPVGIGWSYSIDERWTEPAPGNQVMVFVKASIRIKAGDAWSEPIPGIGGSHLIRLEYNQSSKKKELKANDEGFKMACTDALSVAMKALGVGAKVYQGLWDGSKYLDPAPQNTEEGTPPPPPPEPEPEPEGPRSKTFVSLSSTLTGLKKYQDICEFMPKAKKELSEVEYAAMKVQAMKLLKDIDQANLLDWGQYFTDLADSNAVSDGESDNLRSLIMKLSPNVQAKLAKEFVEKLPSVFGSTK